MSHNLIVSRRRFVAAGMAIGAGVTADCAAAQLSQGESTMPVTGPLAQDYVVLTLADKEVVFFLIIVFCFQRDNLNVASASDMLKQTRC